ncbi:hypothetical protein ACWOC1_10635 [Enterococcus quebecensis]|uniref:Uncharacterized protein n=1 Tax=Enterococcus quebecensis TaxID=903983 RepID=A0A1E5H1N5_9ENTE|nr:hypothetical protein [Enterococcus quebecensis]OEG18831.1 hypothetical protein BCR23_12880 [Enterococcus quebecensis]OJG71817.1 hypothetical protein RV12_GL001459 [Enterococcus quebecensis]
MKNLYLPNIEEDVFEKICCTENLYLNLKYVKNDQFKSIEKNDRLTFENSEKILFEVLEVKGFSELQTTGEPITIFSINLVSDDSVESIEQWQLLKVKTIGKKMDTARLDLLKTLLNEYMYDITDRYMPLYPIGSPEQAEADEMVTRIYETRGALEQSKFTKEIASSKIEK